MDVNVLSHVPDLPRRRAADARVRRRADREHLVGHAVPRRAVPPALRHEQGRDRRVHARAREGARGRGARQLRRARVHDERRRARSTRRSSRRCRASPSRRARSSATRCPRTSPARSRSSAAPSPRSSPARPWSSTEASTSIETLADAQGGAAPAARTRIAHELEDGTTLVWELGEEAPDGRAAVRRGRPRRRREWLMRCDRIDFVPGGIAYRHTHPGPGIRYLLFGEITIDSEGEDAHATARVSRGSSAGPIRCSRPRRPTSRPRSSRVLAPARGVGGQADDHLRRPGRRGQAQDPAPDGVLRAAGGRCEPQRRAGPRRPARPARRRARVRRPRRELPAGARRAARRAACASS